MSARVAGWVLLACAVVGAAGVVVLSLVHDAVEPVLVVVAVLALAGGVAAVLRDRAAAAAGGQAAGVTGREPGGSARRAPALRRQGPPA